MTRVTPSRLVLLIHINKPRLTVIQNPQTFNHRSVSALEAPVKWILSATPLSNDATDLVGYLHLFWKREWKWTRGVRTDEKYAILKWYQDRGKNYDSTYQYWHNNNPLSLLEPHFFNRMIETGMLVGQNTRDVFGPIIEILQMRRTKATVEVIRGEKLRIGSTIPPYSITTVELQHTPQNQKEYLERYHAYVKRADELGKFGLPSKSKKKKTSRKGGAKDPKKIKEPGPHATNFVSVETPTGIRNMGIHRLLSLLTLDLHLEVFASNATKKSLAPVIEEMMGESMLSALCVFWGSVVGERGMPMYVDRYSLACWLALKSPKLQYLAGYLLRKLFPEDGAEKGRPLIFVKWPASHLLVYMFLTVLGLDVGSLRSGLPEAERRELLTRFNDPNSDIDAMIASYAAGSTSLNLQHGSCDMITMEVGLLIWINKPHLPHDTLR